MRRRLLRTIMDFSVPIVCLSSVVFCFAGMYHYRFIEPIPYYQMHDVKEFIKDSQSIKSVYNEMAKDGVITRSEFAWLRDMKQREDTVRLRESN